MESLKGIYPDEVRYPEFNIEEFRKEYEAFCMKNRLNTHKKPRKPYEPEPYKPKFEVNYKILPDTYYIIPQIRKELYFFSLKCPRRPYLSEYEPVGIQNDNIWLDKCYDSLKKAERQLEVILNGDYDYKKWKFNMGATTHDEVSSIRYRLKMIKNYRSLLDDYKVKLEEYQFDYNEIENRLNEAIRKHAEHKCNIVQDKFIKEELYRQTLYENHYDEYLQRKEVYDEKMIKWGVDDFTIKDYLLFRYVKPLCEETNSIVLASGEQYEFRKWVHFVRTSDFVYDVNRGKMEHQKSFREFLNLNPHIKRNGSDIRAIEPWTYGRFTETWVLNHFTSMFSLDFLNQ